MINVLIVPAGSGMAIAAIQALKKTKDIRIVTADSNKLSPGLHLSQKGYLIPLFKEPNFYNSLFNIIDKEKIDVVIPAYDTILHEFSEKNEEFEKHGTKLLLSSPEAISATRDKWITYQKLKDQVSFPISFIQKEDIDIDYPLHIKPRDGSGSINTFKIENEEELDFYLKKVPNPIIQEFLPGKEYTVDCLANNKGELMVNIARERIETKAGISTKGLIVNNNKINEIAKTISQLIKFYGPFFFQVKEDKFGNPKVMEINPRISGTMSLSSYSGVNIHELAIRQCMNQHFTIPEIKYGIYISRYLQDLYFDEKDFNIQKEGQ
ncbi:ATP-grasp domain-containing protein [Nanoarchaeota archaeon]